MLTSNLEAPAAAHCCKEEVFFDSRHISSVVWKRCADDMGVGEAAAAALISKQVQTA